MFHLWDMFAFFCLSLEQAVFMTEIHVYIVQQGELRPHIKNSANCSHLLNLTSVFTATGCFLLSEQNAETE